MKLSRVLLFPDAYWHWLWPEFAAGLKNRTGCAIRLICSRKEDAAYYRARHRDLFESVECVSPLQNGLKDATASAASLAREARDLERAYGIRMSDLIAADRHIGMAYCRGGPMHPRSRQAQGLDYWKTLHVAVTSLRTFETLIDACRPDLLIGTAGTLAGKAWNVVARKRGIPTRGIIAARQADYYYWCENEYLENSAIERAYRELEAAQSDVELLATEAPCRSRHVARSMLDSAKWTVMAQRMARTALKHGYSVLRGYDKGKNYLLSEQLACIRRVRQDFRELRRLPTVRSSEVAERFVFFPLQVEPESTMGVCSVEFLDQPAAVHLVAKELPAGVRLAVKEHIFAVGRRPRGFYRDLSNHPSVLLVDPTDNAQDWIARSEAVVCFTSTAGQEAAVLGKPVVTFSVHNNYRFLPHVREIRGWQELRDALDWAVAPRPADSLERDRRAGARFLHALKASSFDLGPLGIHGRTKAAPATAQEAAVFLDSLIASLTAERMEAALK